MNWISVTMDVMLKDVSVYGTALVLHYLKVYVLHDLELAGSLPPRSKAEWV